MNRWEKDKFIDRLIDSKGADEGIVNSEVRKILYEQRRREAIDPRIVLLRSLFRFGQVAWEHWYVKCRRAAKKIRSSTDEASDSGAGAGSVTSAAAQGAIAARAAGFTGVSTLSACGTPPAATFDGAGIRAGEVTAYRCWKLGSDGFLRSVIYDNAIWKPGEPMEGNPAIPSQGIYAYKSVLLLHRYGEPDATSVSGTVHLWGEVYEHEYGYRAQYAAIASIDDSPYYDAAALRKRYGLKKKRAKKK